MMSGSSCSTSRRPGQLTDCEARPHGIICDGDATLGEGVNCSDGGGGVFGLVRAEKRQSRLDNSLRAGDSDLLTTQVVSEDLDGVRRPDVNEGRSGFLRSVPNDLRRRGERLWRHHRHAARRDDRRLLPRNRFDGVAEDVGVLEREGRDDRYLFRLKNVGAVDAPTKADLDDLRVESMLPKRKEPEGGQQVEGHEPTVVEDCRVHRRLQLRLDEGRKLGFGDELAVDADALAVLVEVRAGEEARRDPGSAEDRVDHRRHAAFAFRAGDVDGRAPEMRVAELTEERDDGRDVRAVLETAGALEVSEGQQVFDGSGVVHAADYTSRSPANFAWYGRTEAKRSVRPRPLVTILPLSCEQASVGGHQVRPTDVCARPCGTPAAASRGTRGRPP